MLEQDQPAAGTEHAGHLIDRRLVVGDAAQRKSGDDGVDGAVGDGQPLGVARASIPSLTSTAVTALPGG